MKIKRSVPPRLPPLALETKRLLSQIESIPEDELIPILSGIESWNWPKVDLFHFIPALNRFDAILERIISSSGLDSPGIQLNAFSDKDKQLLLQILKFEKVLLEHSTNRRLFQSIDRLDCLLCSTDIDVLDYTLRLLLRPAQHQSIRFFHSASADSGIRRIQEKLYTLASSWGLSGRQQPKDAEDSERRSRVASGSSSQPLKMLALADPDTIVEKIEKDMHWYFYRRLDPKDVSSASNPGTDHDQNRLETPETSPRKPSHPASNHTKSGKKDSSTNSNMDMTLDTSESSEGSIVVKISPQQIEHWDASAILTEANRTYHIPPDLHLELLHRIRIWKCSQNVSERLRLLQIRLLSIAILAHLLCEDTSAIASRLTVYEPEIIPHIAELSDLTQPINEEVVACAYNALDGLARMKNKLPLVLSSINANVNHGRLITTLVRLAEAVCTPSSSLNTTLIDAVIYFISYLFTSGSGGQMLIQAGVIPILVSILHAKERSRQRIVSRIVHTIDTVIHSFQSGFMAFMAAKGLDTVIARVKFEVDEVSLRQNDFGSETSSEASVELVHFGEVQYSQSALIKSLLRLLQRMLASSNTAEGLRGLFDTSLSPTLLCVIEHSSMYGSIVFAHSVNLLSTLIHQEPTALPIYIESGLPQAFLKALDGGIQPHHELLAAIPTALGAIGLHESGLQLISKSKVIERLFDIFLDMKHVEVLLDKEYSTNFGSGIDELLRHHPSLRDRMFKALFACFKRIHRTGSVLPDGVSREKYCLSSPGQLSGGLTKRSENSMPFSDTPNQSTTAENKSAPDAVEKEMCLDTSSDLTAKVTEEPFVRIIDASCRFLEGFLQHPSHCITFVNKGGLPEICKLYNAFAIPYDFVGTSASETVTSLLRLIAESDQASVVNILAKTLGESIQAAGLHFDLTAGASPIDFRHFLDGSSESQAKGNEVVRCLIPIHSLANALCEVFSHFSQASSRSGSSLISSLAQADQLTQIRRLGILHQILIWENINLKHVIPQAWMDDMLFTSKVGPHSTANALMKELQGLEHSDAAEAQRSTFKDRANPSYLNARILKYLATQLPAELTVLMQSIVKHFSNSRRSLELNHESILKISQAINDVLQQHLSWSLPQDNVHSSTAYISTVLSLAYELLIDPLKPAVHTFLVRDFHESHGFDKVQRIFERLAAAHIEVSKTKDDFNTRAHRARTEIGLQMIGKLYQHLTNSKLIYESNQTAILVSIQDKEQPQRPKFDVSNFLIELRLASVTSISIAWSSDWLPSMSATAIKTFIRSVAQILGCEGETNISAKINGQEQSSISVGPHAEGRTANTRDTSTTELINPANPFHHDDVTEANRLQQSGNNASRAAQHLPAQPSPTTNNQRRDTSSLESGQNSIQTALEIIASSTANTDATGGSEEMLSIDSNGQSTTDVPKKLDTAPDALAAGKKGKLDFERGILAEKLESRALLFAKQHTDLFFDLKVLYYLPDTKSHALRRHLLMSIEAASLKDGDNSEIANELGLRLRMLALLLHDEEAFKEFQKDFTPLITSIQRVAQNVRIIFMNGAGQVQEWLPPLLLCAEVLLLSSEKTPTCEWVDRNAKPKAPIDTVPVDAAFKNQIADICLHAIRSYSLDKDNLAVILKILTLLTRSDQFANQFFSDGLTSTLVCISKQVLDVKGLRPMIAVLLRHMIESEPYLSMTMIKLLDVWFARQSRSPELEHFGRVFAGTFIRHQNVFLECCKKRLKLVRRAGPTSTYELSYTSDKSEEAARNVDESQGNAIYSKLSTRDGSLTENWSRPLIDKLARELARVPSIESSQIDKESIKPADLAVANGKSEAFKESDNPAYLYRCLILQLLTDMVLWSDACKMAFMKQHYGKLRSDGSLEHETSLFNHVLLDLVPYGCLTPTQDPTFRKQAGQANWAIVLIVALCAETREQRIGESGRPDLVALRRSVLDAILKSFKESINARGSLESKFGRLFALADLSYRLVTMKQSKDIIPENTGSPTFTTPIEIARLMLEKNFVPVLTSALAGIDYNFPSIQILISSLLRPLEILSKVSHKMSKLGSGENPKEVFHHHSPSVEDDDAGLGEEEDLSREQTPDLYRHSALGMYRGELETPDSDEEAGSSESAEMYDEEEFEDTISGSDVSDADDDEPQDTQGEMDIEVVMPYDDDDDEEGDDSLSSGSGSSQDDSMEDSESEPSAESGSVSNNEWLEERLTGLPDDSLSGNGDLGLPPIRDESVEENEAIEDGLVGLEDEDYDEDGEIDPFEEELMEMEDRIIVEQQRGRDLQELGWPDIGHDLSLGTHSANLDERLTFDRPRHGVFLGRSHRGQPTNTAGLHGLLVPDSDRPEHAFTLSRHISGNNFTNRMHSLERLMGDSAHNAIELLDQLLQRTAQRDGQPIRVEVVSSTGQPLTRVGQRDESFETAHREQSRIPVDPILAVQDFHPTSNVRWQQEATMILEQEGVHAETANRLVGLLAYTLWDTMSQAAGTSTVAESAEGLSGQEESGVVM